MTQIYHASRPNGRCQRGPDGPISSISLKPSCACRWSRWSGVVKSMTRLNCAVARSVTPESRRKPKIEMNSMDCPALSRARPRQRSAWPSPAGPRCCRPHPDFGCLRIIRLDVDHRFQSCDRSAQRAPVEIRHPQVIQRRYVTRFNGQYLLEERHGLVNIAQEENGRHRIFCRILIFRSEILGGGLESVLRFRLYALGQIEQAQVVLRLAIVGNSFQIDTVGIDGLVGLIFDLVEDARLR